MEPPAETTQRTDPHLVKARNIGDGAAAFTHIHPIIAVLFVTWLM